MKITFFSNFLNHHQLPLCLEFIAKKVDFKFVATEMIPTERLKLGYEDMNNKYDFVIRTYENKCQYELAKKLALESDIVIYGAAPYKFVENRIKCDEKVTFRYSERLFKKGRFQFFKSRMLLDSIIKHKTYNNYFLLCASAYAAKDYNMCGQFINKSYKWGYFPKIDNCDVAKLMREKQKKILWVGRFVDFKKPEEVVLLAKYLRRIKVKASIEMVGTGPKEKQIKTMIQKLNLSDYIDVIGSLPNNDVIKKMKESSIFIFTSDKGEGWGAVLNEAMNCGCAVVANYHIGSVPYLIKQCQNGYYYTTRQQFYNYVTHLLLNPAECYKIGYEAYLTIVNKWNAKTAVENLMILYEDIVHNNNTTIIDGPCSIDSKAL